MSWIIPVIAVVAALVLGLAFGAAFISHQCTLFDEDNIEALSWEERETLETLLNLAYASWALADNAEDRNGDEVVVERRDFDLIAKYLDQLDELPDNQPDYVMNEPAKARWALRRLLMETSA